MKESLLQASTMKDSLIVYHNNKDSLKDSLIVDDLRAVEISP